MEYKSPHHCKTTDRYCSTYFIFITKVMIQSNLCFMMANCHNRPQGNHITPKLSFTYQLPFLRFPATILRSFWRCCILSLLLVMMECCILGMHTCVNTSAVRTCHHQPWLLPLGCSLTPAPCVVFQCRQGRVPFS